MEVYSHPTEHEGGFTLVELMIVVAMMAILGSIAYPSLTQSIANNRVRTQSTEILNILAFARSEAISRGTVVTVTPSVNWTGIYWNNRSWKYSHKNNRTIGLAVPPSANRQPVIRLTPEACLLAALFL